MKGDRASGSAGANARLKNQIPAFTRTLSHLAKSMVGQRNLAPAGSVRYDGAMSKAAAQIEQQFKKLAPKDQAELYDRLGSVVYEETGENEELIRTLKRRVHEIESGAVKGRDAFEVLDELKARHSR